MSSHRNRPAKKQSNKYDKNDNNHVNSPRNRGDGENSESINFNANQTSHFAKDRKNSVIEKHEENLEYKVNKKTKRVKQKQAIQAHPISEQQQESRNMLSNGLLQYQNSDQIRS